MKTDVFPIESPEKQTFSFQFAVLGFRRSIRKTR